MSKRTTVGILSGLSLAGYSLYKFRRQLIARQLKLPPVKNKVTVDHSLHIQMPDGVKLAATHYAPVGSGAYPTILERTPYGRNNLLSASIGRWYAERGYHVIVQDTRGRFDAEGVFEPFVNESSDGRVTADWITEQAWFNGSLAISGASYPGYIQWALAVQNPPYLKALVPAITSSEFYTVTYYQGIFGLDGSLRWLLAIKINSISTFVKEVLAQFNRRKQEEYLLQEAYAHLPIGDDDKIVTGKTVPFYQKWLAHPDYDSYWQSIDLSDKVGQVQAPAHFVSGWYDFMLPQLLADYARMKAAGHTPYLTLGPWSHLSLVGLMEQVRQGVIWFDAHLKGDRNYLRSKPVRFYVTGAKQWRETESWPPPSQAQTYFLHSLRQLSTDRPLANSEPDRYCFDPANPTPAVGGALFSPHAGSKDNRTLEARPDVLTYTTSPLTSDLEVSGPLRLDLYVRSSLEHTDFFCRLCDVWPDGRSFNVCDGIFRVEPGKAEPEVDGSLHLEMAMWDIAHLFKRGHRLRLQVSSSAYPRWSRNMGTGEPLATATKMVSAEQTIFHDEVHPSALTLPVLSD